MRLGLIIYGNLDTLTGGYIYDRILVEHLQSRGHRVDIISLPRRNYGRHLLDNFSLGLRGEQFSTENTEYIGLDPNDEEAKSISAITLSANIGSGALKFIPEIRLDNASGDVFLDSNGNATGSAAQFLIAAVFGF